MRHTRGALLTGVQTWPLPIVPGDPGDGGKPAAALEEWLRSLSRRTKEEGVPITHWFFEAQHVSSKNNIDTIYRLIALGGVIEKFAYQVMPKGQKKPWVYKEIGRASCRESVCPNV